MTRTAPREVLVQPAFDPAQFDFHAWLIHFESAGILVVEAAMDTTPSPLERVDPSAVADARIEAWLDEAAELSSPPAVGGKVWFLSSTTPKTDLMRSISECAAGSHVLWARPRFEYETFVEQWHHHVHDDDPESSDTELRRVRARKELDGLAEVRAAARANKAGTSQRRIAELLGTSQASVHRLLRKARVVDEHMSPREIILKYVAGEISRGALLGRLSALSRGVHAGTLDDGYAPGTWDEVRTAFLDGLLGDAEYDALQSAFTQRPRGEEE